MAEPSKYQELAALVSQLGLSHKLYEEFLSVLEEQNTRIYALEQDMKRMVAASRAHDQKYSDLLYQIKASKK